MTNKKKIKNYILRLINITDHINIPAAMENIRNNIYFRGPNVWILAFSIVIASVGLNVNSTAVIIGAMLVSPLMGPIFGLGLGLGINDTKLIKNSLRNLGIMITISIVASCLYFFISPLDLDNPTELLARTNPTIYDVLIALFGGFAGIFELSRKEKGTVGSGVAIATALMPPLCTAGYGLASGKILYFLGAFYLFFINCAFITLATYFSVRYMGFPSVSFDDNTKKKRTKKIISLAVVILIIPSLWSAITVIQQNRFNIAARHFLSENKNIGNCYIYNHNIDHHKESKLEIFVAGNPLTAAEKDMLYKSAERFDIDREQLIITETANISGADSNDELLKGIYKITDNEIEKREKLIAQLEEELRNIKNKDIDYAQIAKELTVQMPDITSLAITRGAGVNVSDYSTVDGIYILINKSGNKEYETKRIESWLKVRLKTDNIRLIIMQDSNI